MKNSRVLSGLFVAVLFVVTAQTAMAQSTIFNIPTTDTVSKGKGYFEFDFLSQAPATVSGHGPTFTTRRLVVGLGDKAEAGVNFVTYTLHAASRYQTFGYFQPNFKVKYLQQR